MASKRSERVLTDHKDIRKWVESRQAQPACVKDTEGNDGSCLLRIDFPGYSGADTLKPIPWDQWFRVFDKRKLALVVEDRMADGQPSNFNKLVKRESVSSEA